MKKPFKITLAIFVAIFLYLGIAFAMRDQGEFWCDMSNGNYQPTVDCTRCRDFESPDPDTCCKEGPEFVCARGLFNSRGGKA